MVFAVNLKFKLSPQELKAQVRVVTPPVPLLTISPTSKVEAFTASEKVTR